MEKLDINLFPESLKEKYANYVYDREREIEEMERKKRNYIADYTEYRPGGLLSTGYRVRKPDIGLVEWERIYGDQYKRVNRPVESFSEWSKNQITLNSRGEQYVVDKINEVISWINDYESTINSPKSDDSSPKG